jgi:RimJ/RimL family protein N-acetyltransferase
MEYNCLKINILVNEEFRIKPITKSDIECIRLWRNMQMDVLRQKKVITRPEQINYFDNVLLPLFSQEYPSQIIFSYFKGETLIGYGGLVHISWEDKRSEMSFLLNPEFLVTSEIYEEYFSMFINLIREVNFSILGFHKLFTETYCHRFFHISILEKNGFELEGVLRDHVIIGNKYFDSLIHSIINNV